MSFCTTFFRPLAAGVAVMLCAGSASALTFEGTYDVSPYHSSTSYGLGFDVYNINPLVLNLNPGETTGLISLFSIKVTDNTGIDQGDDTTHSEIKINFTFDTPAGAGNIGGETFGTLRKYSDGIPAHFNLAWGTDNPLTIDFGSGVSLLIALQNVDFTCDFGGTHDRCKPNPDPGSGGTPTSWASFDVYGTVTYVGRENGGDVSATPIPGALPMFVSGLGLIGGFGYAKRRKARKQAV